MSDGVVNVVGVGNTLMGDDGTGPAAIEALQSCRALPQEVRLYDAGLAVSDVLGTLDPASPLVVIDSLRGGGPAGTVYRARLADIGGAGAELAGCVSLHEMSVLPALRMEAMTGREFADVTVFGIEPQRLAWGEGLSPAVSGAMGPLVDRVLESLAERRKGEVAGDNEA